MLYTFDIIASSSDKIDINRWMKPISYYSRMNEQNKFLSARIISDAAGTRGDITRIDLSSIYFAQETDPWVITLAFSPALFIAADICLYLSHKIRRDGESSIGSRRTMHSRNEKPCAISPRVAAGNGWLLFFSFSSFYFLFLLFFFFTRKSRDVTAPRPVTCTLHAAFLYRYRRPTACVYIKCRHSRFERTNAVKSDWTRATCNVSSLR